jgi:hypothetical protein
MKYKLNLEKDTSTVSKVFESQPIDSTNSSSRNGDCKPFRSGGYAKVKSEISGTYDKQAEPYKIVTESQTFLGQDDDLENNFITTSSEVFKINQNSIASSPKDSVGTSESDFIINIDLNSDDCAINNIQGENTLKDYTNTGFYIKRTNKEADQWFNITDLSFHINYILNITFIRRIQLRINI